MSITANAQIMRADELEEYSKERYGEKWVEAAAYIVSELVSLDKNNAISLVEVIPAEGKTQEELYVLLNYWFTATFNDANAVIKLNDKELGSIIASGYVDGIAYHTGGANRYKVDLRPVIKCDIKDEKVRVTYTVPFYPVTVSSGGGIMGVMSNTKPVDIDANWVLDKCYPFAQKDSHKKTSSKALVMSYAYSNVIIDKIKECVTSGLVGNEGDDW